MTYGEHKGLPCTAPCSMYSVLLQHGLIDDPYYGLNELKATPLSENGCVFETEFTADEDIVEKEYIELHFFGLDTICRITVNGIVVDNVQNMHREYVYDVKNLIVKGKNKIRLQFSSPTEYFKKMNNKHWLYTNGDTIPGAAHLRKALYMSGWDWGPTLPDIGIFRPVCIDAYNTDKIDSIFVKQQHENNKVILDIEVETRHNAEADVFVEIDGQKIKLDNNKKGVITIDNPKLWWVRGYGEQPLYEINAKIKKSDKTIDEKSQKIGLRTITVSTQADDIGNEFCFVVNGVKIFAMGANYIPQDSILSRINPDRTEELIKAAIDANFNCLRIWGGGYYPEDEFYDICDKYGILVWQDFMIACANVWLRREMKEEYTKEAIDNVKRLRHHPSLGMLCGNNEMELAVLNWGAGKSQLVREDYIELYERIFPEICEKYTPETFYWPASPSSEGGLDNPNDETRGDVHYWKVWHGGIPFTEYRNHVFRFCSEYGFESYPSMKTIKSFCEPKDMNCFSRVMENHQKCKSGNMKILMYLANSYLYPNTFETLVYASQLLQADAIKYGVEHFRRNRGCCMGSLFWQFNDCWPVASWSSVDYFGRYKALHYAAKKFYAPVAMGLFLEKDVLTVNISNETMSDFEGKIYIYHCDSKLNKINTHTYDVSVKSLKARDVFSFETNCKNKHNEFIYVDLYDNNDNFIMRQTELFVPSKHFEWEKPEIKINMTDHKDGVHIEVSSDVFAKGVYLDFDGYDCVLSDNFFDLTNGNKYSITVNTEYTAAELAKAVKILTVYDIGR